MKKILLFVVTALFSVNAFTDGDFSKPPSVPIEYVKIGNFKTFAEAKAGAIASDIRTVPEWIISPNRFTTPQEDDRVTCVLEKGESGKAVNSKGELVGVCEITDAVNERMGEVSKNWKD